MSETLNETTNETMDKLDLSDRKTRLKQKMQETRQELVSLLESVTPAQLEMPSDNEGWTVYDLACHVAGAEGGMEVIAQRILAKEPSMIAGFDIDRYNAGNIKRRHGKAVADLIEELNTSRARMNAIIDSVTDEQLDLPGQHPTYGDTTLYGLFVIIYRHERIHTEDIKKAIKTSDPQ